VQEVPGSNPGIPTTFSQFVCHECAMDPEPMRTKRNVHVLQAPGQGSLAAMAQNEFMRALLEPTGLPDGALEPLRDLSKAARVIEAAAIREVLAMTVTRQESRQQPPNPRLTEPDRIRDIARARLLAYFPANDDPRVAHWVDWARRRRIEAPCVVRWAFGVSLAVEGQRDLRRLVQVRAFVGAVPDDVKSEDIRVQVVISGRLTEDTEEQFVARAEVSARRAFRAAKKRLQYQYGFERLSPHPALGEHCRWVLRRYLHGETPERIAEGKNEAVVRRTIRDTRTLIGLPDIRTAIRRATALKTASGRTPTGTNLPQ
jgi:hypothetical protein